MVEADLIPSSELCRCPLICQMTKVLCEMTIPHERFVALVALKRYFPGMRHLVRLQSATLCASVIALVALIWLLSSVCQYVLLQA